MAKKPRKQLTPNQAEWNRQVKRIQKFQKSFIKHGYNIPNLIPSTPKVITKSKLENIRNIKPSIAKALAIGEDKLTPSGRRYALSSKKALKELGIDLGSTPIKAPSLPKVTDLVLGNVEKLIEQWEPSSSWTPFFNRVKENDKNILANILKGEIQRRGRDVVARHLENSAEDIISLVEKILYDSGGKNGRQETQKDIIKFMSILKGSKLNSKESIEAMDMMEAEDYFNPTY